VRGVAIVGWLLVGIPLPLAVALRLDVILFGAALVAFAVGAALLLAGRDDEGRGALDLPDEPPWWPEFERSFRAYARRRPRPRVPS
jgi:hypothetical protein